MAGIDKEMLLAWLDERANERAQRGTATSSVQYAIYAGLRDRAARGDFDEREPDEG